LTRRDARDHASSFSIITIVSQSYR
jgi:hypothetical protein